MVQTLELCEGDNEENWFDNLFDRVDSYFQPKVNKRILAHVWGYSNMISRMERGGGGGGGGGSLEIN